MSQILERVSEKVQQVVAVQNLELYISSPKQTKNGGKNTLIVRAGERISGIVRLAKSADIGKHGNYFFF